MGVAHVPRMGGIQRLKGRCSDGACWVGGSVRDADTSPGGSQMAAAFVGRNRTGDAEPASLQRFGQNNSKLASRPQASSGDCPRNLCDDRQGDGMLNLQISDAAPARISSGLIL